MGVELTVFGACDDWNAGSHYVDKVGVTTTTVTRVTREEFV